MKIVLRRGDQIQQYRALGGGGELCANGLPWPIHRLSGNSLSYPKLTGIILAWENTSIAAKHWLGLQKDAGSMPGVSWGWGWGQPLGEPKQSSRAPT